MDISDKKYILVAALDWGLGHAGRCVPLIRFLIEQGHQVKIGGSGDSLELLRKEFPDLKSIVLPSYNVDYPSTGSLKIHLIAGIPRWRKVMIQEHEFLKQLIDSENLIGVVSDNRPGLWSSDIPSIYMTHQYTVQSGVTTAISSFLHRRLFRNFDRIWIPDRPGENNLAGKLSQSGLNDPKVDFIGPLTRVQKKELKKDIDVLALLGGPETARQRMEEILMRSLRDHSGSTIVVRGSFSGKPIKEESERVKVIDYALGDQLEDLLNRSRVVIARSGYSSLMDLNAIDSRIVLIPTEGQTEQEYLAHYWSRSGKAVMITEKKADLEGIDLTFGEIPKSTSDRRSLLTKELLEIFTPRA